MKVEMVMPQMGESIAEGTILKWLKGVGDAVTIDEDILEISTDKVDTEIPSPATGKIAQILVKEGQTVAIKTLLAIIETEAGAEVAGTGAVTATETRPPAPSAPPPPPRKRWGKDQGEHPPPPPPFNRRWGYGCRWTSRRARIVAA